MGDGKVEKTNSGVKKRGSWKDIAEFSEKVEEAVKGKADPESMEKFDEWRPKLEEAEGDIKRKTVEEAELDKNGMEKESNGIKRDLRDASEKTVEAGKKAANKKNPEKEVVKASEDAAKPFYSKLAKAFREFEKLVYSKIALRFNPYYLDTDDFSVDMKNKGNGSYEMDVRAPEEETRRKLKQEFREKE